MRSSTERYSNLLYRIMLRIEEATQEATDWLYQMLNDEECASLKEDIEYVLKDGYIDKGVRVLADFIEVLDAAKMRTCDCGCSGLKTHATKHHNSSDPTKPMFKYVGFVTCKECGRYSVTDFLLTEAEAEGEAIRLWNKGWVS